LTKSYIIGRAVLLPLYEPSPNFDTTFAA